MPIYEYQCRACEHEFEQLVKSSRGRAAVDCPECGSRQTERKLSVFAARQGTNASSSLPDPCARCGDPNGACPYQT